VAGSPEHCRNPWKNDCKNENIAVYIEWKGRRVPLCQSCWEKIAESDLEW